MQDKLGIPLDRQGAVWLNRDRVRTPRKAGWYRHTHAELEAGLVVSGYAVYVIGDTQKRIARGDLVWLFPQQEHQLLDLSADFRHIITVWRKPLVRSQARELAQPLLAAANPPGVWIRQLPSDEVQQLIALLSDVAQQTDSLTINSGLRYVLQRLWNAFQEAPQQAATNPLVSAALAALRDTALPIPELAHQLGVSSDHLRRVVQTATGRTLVAVRQRYALERFFAIYQPDEGLMSAALAAGFGSYPQFHRVFRQLLGVSPQTWLKQVATGQATRHPRVPGTCRE